MSLYRWATTYGPSQMSHHWWARSDEPKLNQHRWDTTFEPSEMSHYTMRHYIWTTRNEPLQLTITNEPLTMSHHKWAPTNEPLHMNYHRCSHSCGPPQMSQYRWANTDEPQQMSQHRWATTDEPTHRATAWITNTEEPLKLRHHSGYTWAPTLAESLIRNYHRFRCLQLDWKLFLVISRLI
jgi:hypothetical protein